MNSTSTELTVRVFCLSSVELVRRKGRIDTESSMLLDKPKTEYKN
jgi:hypothetical protein